jgi:hypothetical protein
MSEANGKPSLSLVALEIGSVNTRAQFFDSVEGRYRFLAAGEAHSTVGSPAFDLNVGVLDALTQLQETTGRQLLSERGLLISADPNDTVGVNAVTTTFSGGPPLKVVTAGLLDGVSLKSVNKLVNTSYSHIVETFGLNDRRSPENIIDAICQHLPDLIVLAGGTNRGASRSVIRLANYLALALNLIPEKQRPEMLFVGNENLQEEIDNLLGSLTKLHLVHNIRPSLDQESSGPAEARLADIYFSIQARKLGGLEQIRSLSAGHLHPGANGFGRVVRFLSTVIDAPKGMLGVDLGASSTTVASAFAGELEMRVYPGLGVGSGLTGMIAETHLQQITRWLPFDVSDDFVLDYLYNKPLFPHSLPTTPEELAVEQAAARQAMRLAIGKSLPLFPADAIYPLPGTVPWFDRILVSGSAVTRAPRLEQSLLMILDAIQPVGITTIILDQNNLAASVGASAEIDPLMAVQVLESNAFVNLGTIISPVGAARSGSPILRIQMLRDGQKEPVVEIKEGGLSVLPLAPGKVADLYIHPLQNVNIGLGPGRGGWVRRVVGGVFGVVIDARGRPVQVPTSFNRRQETLQAWHNALSGI